MTARRGILLPLLGLIVVSTIGATISDLNEAGKAAYGRGDYATAERLFSQALAQAPRDPLLHYHHGVALMRLSRWREASAAFETALRLNPPPDVVAAARQGIRSIAPLLREPAPRSANRDETLVPLRRAGGNWVAEVRLNDLRTAQFLVDTGASTCIISPQLARDLGIRPDPGSEPVPFHTLSGPTNAHVVKIPSIRVGDLEAENVIAAIHSLGPSLDGILGNTFLSRFTVTLDPRRGFLHLVPR